MDDKDRELMYEKIKDGRYYRAMVKESPVAILLSDQSGAFVDANDAAAKFFGYSVEELRKMRFQQVTHRDDMVVSMEMVNTLNLGGADHFEMVKRYLTKTGITWAAVKVNAVREENGRMSNHVIHIIPLLGCTDDVMKDVVGRIAGKSNRIEFTRGAVITLIALAMIIEVITHVLMK